MFARPRNLPVKATVKYGTPVPVHNNGNSSSLQSPTRMGKTTTQTNMYKTPTKLETSRTSVSDIDNNNTTVSQIHEKTKKCGHNPLSPNQSTASYQDHEERRESSWSPKLRRKFPFPKELEWEGHPNKGVALAKYLLILARVRRSRKQAALNFGPRKKDTSIDYSCDFRITSVSLIFNN